MLVDEIRFRLMLSKLKEQSFPKSVRMILVLNPSSSYDGSPLTLPPSFLHVTLKTPYRSTRAITFLARFIAAKCKGLDVPDIGQSLPIGSDVEGIRPIFFDIGKDERKMEEALEECHKQLGNNVTILYDSDSNCKTIERWMSGRADWYCYDAGDFTGWEDDQVVVVTSGEFLLEMITRAKTMLYVLLVDNGDSLYSEAKGYFQQAAEQELVEMK